MKRIIAAAALTLFTVGVAPAADVMEFNAAGKMGKVTFNHKMHQDTLKDCKTCHKEGTPGKMANFNKDTAHKELCKDCHTKMGKGPTGCKDCHKK